MAFVPRASTHPSQIEAAKYLLAEPGFTIAHIPRQFNVGRSRLLPQLH